MVHFCSANIFNSSLYYIIYTTTYISRMQTKFQECLNLTITLPESTSTQIFLTEANFIMPSFTDVDLIYFILKGTFNYHSFASLGSRMDYN